MMLALARVLVCAVADSDPTRDIPSPSPQKALTSQWCYWRWPWIDNYKAWPQYSEKETNWSVVINKMDSYDILELT